MIRIDVRGVVEAQRELRSLERKIRERVVVRALDRASKAMETVVVRELYQELFLPREEITSVVRTRRPSVSEPEAVVTVSHKPVKLVKFAARKTRKGVSVRVKRRGGARKVVKRGFLATMESGHHNVFTRRGPKRLPIDSQMGPTPLQVARNRDGLIDRVQEVAVETFTKRVRHELSRVLK